MQHLQIIINRCLHFHSLWMLLWGGSVIQGGRERQIAVPSNTTSPSAFSISADGSSVLRLLMPDSPRHPEFLSSTHSPCPVHKQHLCFAFKMCMNNSPWLLPGHSSHHFSFGPVQWPLPYSASFSLPLTLFSWPAGAWHACHSSPLLRTLHGSRLRIEAEVLAAILEALHDLLSPIYLSTSSVFLPQDFCMCYALSWNALPTDF